MKHDVKENTLIFNQEDLKDRGLIWRGHHLPYNPNLVIRAKELRKNMTEPEKKLWYDYLRKIEPKFLRQRPIDHFIVDFYCPELKIVIEIDGETHFTEAGKGYDKERTIVLEGYGLNVLRFSNFEIMENLSEVCEKIEELARERRS